MECHLKQACIHVDKAARAQGHELGEGGITGSCASRSWVRGGEMGIRWQQDMTDSGTLMTYMQEKGYSSLRHVGCQTGRDSPTSLPRRQVFASYEGAEAMIAWPHLRCLDITDCPASLLSPVYALCFHANLRATLSRNLRRLPPGKCGSILGHDVEKEAASYLHS